MRPIADLYRGEAKTDAKDAAVIAGAARTTPHTLHSPEPTDEITAELTVPVGFDQGLAAEASPALRPEPDTRPAHPVPSQPGTPPAPTWTTRRDLASETLRIPGRTAQSRPPPTRRGDPGQGTAHAPAADRRGLRRAGEQTVVVPRTGTLDVGGTTARVGACGTPAAPPRCRKRSAMLSPGCRPRPETSTRGWAERSL